jgi:hypothetical protein
MERSTRTIRTSTGRKRGQPTSYKPEFAEQAAKLCELGATDQELATFFKVSLSTVYLWRNTHAEFSEAVIAGKDKADARVERAFFGRAVGYSYQSEKVFLNKGKIVRAKVTEHVPADAGAALNWLKNRKPDMWREKSELELTRRYSSMTDDELNYELAVVYNAVRHLTGRSPH